MANNTNLSLAGLQIDVPSLGGDFLLLSSFPYYRYLNNQKTDTVEGYKYKIIMPHKEFAFLEVKIPGARRLDTLIGENIPVIVDGLTIKMYYDNNKRLQLSAKATDIRAMEAVKPSGKA